MGGDAGQRQFSASVKAEGKEVIACVRSVGGGVTAGVVAARPWFLNTLCTSQDHQKVAPVLIKLAKEAKHNQAEEMDHMKDTVSAMSRNEKYLAQDHVRPQY